MNGELAALIAVVLHGNAWLADTSKPAPNLERDNTTFRYVHSLTFVEPRQGLFSRERQMQGTSEWLTVQRTEGVERLALYSPALVDGSLAPHIASAFANGVPRGLVAHGPAPALWSSRWDTHGTQHPQGEIWRVTMTSLALAPLPESSPRSVAEASAELVAALRGARSFALTNELLGWAQWFAKAIAAAADPDPEVPYNPDITPAGWLALDQRQLLAAGFQAWVFGGMGSWNDIWLDDESEADRMQELTKRLYAAVMGALVAVANQ
ncbi:MAG: hypothetical protein DLM59_19195 [Pseudonocardiales bacterium]|nr:MAG: hypothetical protein DLM59_19195 [Pseudonocardiales bacterium]